MPVLSAFRDSCLHSRITNKAPGTCSRPTSCSFPEAQSRARIKALGSSVCTDTHTRMLCTSPFIFIPFVPLGEMPCSYSIIWSLGCYYFWVTAEALVLIPLPNINNKTGTGLGFSSRVNLKQPRGQSWEEQGSLSFIQWTFLKSREPQPGCGEEAQHDTAMRGRVGALHCFQAVHNWLLTRSTQHFHFLLQWRFPWWPPSSHSFPSIGLM